MRPPPPVPPDAAPAVDADERTRWMATLPETNPNPVMRVRLDGIVQYANAAAAAAWLCREGLPLPHPSLTTLLRRAVAASRNLEEDVDVEGHPYSVGMTPLPAEGCVNVYGRNIAARKRMEEDLRRSEAKYRQLFENMTEIMAIDELVLDDRGRAVDWIILDANPAYLNRAGKSRGQMVGRRFSEIFGESPPPVSLAQFERLVRTGESVQYEDYFPALRLSMALSAYALGGRRFAVVITDITARKAAEEALRASEERFRVMFEAHRAVMLLIEPVTGAIVDANEAAVHFYGHSREALRAMRIDQINALPPVAVAAERMKAIAFGKTVFTFPHRLASGEVRWVEVYASPVPVSGKPLLFSIIHDITGRREAEDRLRRTAEELRRSNEDLQQFAHIIGHDLQEPLRMVNGFLTLLREHLGGGLDPKSIDYITLATDGAARMSTLIRAMLDYSRVGRGEPSFRRVEASTAAAEALANLRVAVEEAGAEIVLDPLPAVNGDPAQLMQVFQNLLGNAIKFRAPGRPCRIRVAAVREDRAWRFEIRDNGIGMDMRQAGRIFQIFQRLHGREEYPGTGIGLAVCKKIVERHGGRIWVESAPGEGSTFFFTLPEAP